MKKKKSFIYKFFVTFFTLAIIVSIVHAQTEVFRVDFDNNLWNPVISAPTDQNAAFYCEGSSGTFATSCGSYGYLSGNRFVIRNSASGLLNSPDPWANSCSGSKYFIYQCYPSSGAPVSEKAIWQKLEIPVEQNKSYTFQFEYMKLGTDPEMPRIKVMAIATNYSPSVGYRFYSYMWSDYFNVENNAWTNYSTQWNSGNAVKVWILIYSYVTNTNQIGIGLDNLILKKN